MKTPPYKAASKKPGYYDIISKARRQKKEDDLELKYPDADITIEPYQDSVSDDPFFLKNKDSNDSFFLQNKIPIYEKLGADELKFNPYSLVRSPINFDVLKSIPLRILAIALCLILIIPIFFYGVVKINEYFYVKGALDQAKIFNNVGNYQEALLLLTLTESKWATSNIKSEIDIERQKGVAGLDQQRQEVTAAAASPETDAERLGRLNKVITKANEYLTNVAPSLKRDADRLFEACLATWSKLQSQFPGSDYADYRNGCNENKEIYLRNIAEDERKYAYHKVRSEFLIKKLETGSLTVADLTLYSEITKIVD